MGSFDFALPPASNRSARVSPGILTGTSRPITPKAGQSNLETITLSSHNEENPARAMRAYRARTTEASDEEGSFMKRYGKPILAGASLGMTIGELAGGTLGAAVGGIVGGLVFGVLAYLTPGAELRTAPAVI